jgi:hypothetical protein
VSTVESCSVCGRTMLKGERTRIYITPEGEKRAVCELCRGRAESHGWLWEEAAAEAPAAPQRQRRRRPLLSGLLRGRALARSQASGTEPVETAAEPAAAGDGDGPPPAEPRRSPDPAAPGAQVGRPARARSPLERALARFNHSAHSHTVAGLIRSLGPPSVSVGTAAGAPGEVRITVAWELSWYQWGVDLRDEDRPVHEIDKGHEIGELDASAREWNAHASADGTLSLGGAPATRGEPAGAES